MVPNLLRIATRESPLALWQAEHIRQQLLLHWPKLNIQLLPMTTSGDQFLKDKLQKVGGKGLFTKELEEALLDGRADLAVHSMKDVPSMFPPGLTLAAICLRENPFDAFVSSTYQALSALPQGATVGTSSLRREAQLLAFRPDLHIKPLRGNVGSRLKKLDQKEYDALILATAGLHRLNLHDRVTEIIDEQIMLPACGQGALGIECRDDDLNIKNLLLPLHAWLDALCVNTERAVNAELGGSCHTPVAIYCKPIDNSRLLLQAKVFATDGTQVISHMQTGLNQDAEKLAHLCSTALLKQGAASLLH